MDAAVGNLPLVGTSAPVVVVASLGTAVVGIVLLLVGATDLPGLAVAGLGLVAVAAAVLGGAYLLTEPVEEAPAWAAGAGRLEPRPSVHDDDLFATDDDPATPTPAPSVAEPIIDLRGTVPTPDGSGLNEEITDRLHRYLDQVSGCVSTLERHELAVRLLGPLTASQRRELILLLSPLQAVASDFTADTM